MNEPKAYISQDVVQNLEYLLKQIEGVGGECEDGRQAIERLKNSLEGAGVGSDEVTVMQQIDNIRRKIDLLESRVEGMSDEAYGIISIAGNDAIDLMVSQQPKEDTTEENE